MESVGLHFNGTNSLCTIPVSLSAATSWSVTIVLATDQTDSSDVKIYRQACVFGYDSANYKSKDFHVDLKQGNLFIFSGLVGSNSSSTINTGTLSSDGGDYGWDTQRFIADGNIHLINVRFSNGRLTVFLDNENLGYLNATYSIDSSSLYLGASFGGEKIYSRFDLYDFELLVNDSLIVNYQPTANAVQSSRLVDNSGNNNDGTLTGTFSVTSTQLTIDDFDTERDVTNTQPAFPYINPGRADLLTITGGTTLTDLPASQSTTGIAFYQPTRAACFGIPAIKEIWIRCDIYTTESYKNGDRLRIYHLDNNNKANGFSTNATISSPYMLWHNDVSQDSAYSFASNQLRTLILHMKSDASNGVVEYRLTSGYGDKYTGNVNNGNDFDNVFIQMDGSNIWVSNVIISNEQIEFAEIDYSYDTVRNQHLNIADYGDLLRTVYKPVTLIADTERKVNGILVNDVYDTERVLSRTITATYDMMRQIPHEISDTQQGVLQSLTVSLQEQQLTDNVSFVMAGDINIMDAVAFHAWDYILYCRAEETSKRGVLLSCKCTVDIDEILYQKMSYKIPSSAFQWTTEYNEAYAKYNYLHPTEQVEKMPSAPASAHITSIAGCIGKNVSIQFSDWISTMSTEVKSGTNYAGLIEELFGWTSRLPHLMINCYIRGNTLYAVQRGHENNVVTLDGQKLSVHTINKKIMRMTWGSDPNSNTDVEPLYRSWVSDDLTPFPEQEESGGGGEGTSTIGQNNLVSETEVNHGSERVVTQYKYQDMGGGQQFLYEEIQNTYVGGELIDHIVTTHKPVSYGQAQVYSADDDGVLGSVVSPSNFDERITPYQYGVITSGGYSEAFAGGGHDEYGNYYTAVRDSQGTRYLITGHESHKEQIGQRTRLNAYALVDTSFPVDGYDKLQYLTNQIEWLDRKTEESVTLDIYDYPHLIDFNDRIVWNGNTYFLRSNTAIKTETIVNKQTLEFVRWY